MVKVEKAAIRSMLTAMGAKWANTNVARLEEKLNNPEVLKKLLEEGDEPEGDDLATYKILFKAMEDEEKITILPEEETEEAEHKGNGKAKKSDKAEKPAKKSGVTRPRADADKFGSSPDTVPGKINACISSAVKSVETIAEESGQGKVRVKGHLDWLVKTGLVVAEKKGYREAKRSKVTA